ncbi:MULTISPECIES: hypothetical protein [unclassified Aureimonas]|uniref:hypothetical protein n=1 Tax=unclassified Aureimonas TaxID=2615206 RepID=UPI000721FC69|nr:MULTISPECIES: hypothetical protein [unclassified Aureimonas]ALN74521.1 hypothetical protein M673_17540 [Aureimonas sp. AU20]
MSDHPSTPPRDEQEPKEKTPSAGPHAKPELTNPDATPGAGSLPDEKETGDADGGAG